jgi:hypothetical protein
VVREMLRGYRLHGRVARASRVVVGQHGKSGADAAVAVDQLIGADEAQAAKEAVAAITAADTVPIDEGTLRAIFGAGEEEPE